jgi:hypothetical protein
MKKLIILLISFILAVFFGCSKGNDKESDKDKKKEKGAVEETIDYATGKTPLYEGQKAKRKLIEVSISEAVNYYEVQEGSKPENLQQIVDAGFLNKAYLKDEWGRDLIVQSQNGKLIVRGIGPDKKPNTADDWVKQF